MLARLVLRVAWSLALVLAITSLLRERSAYQILAIQASVGQAPRPQFAQEFFWTISFGTVALWLLVLDLFLLKWLVPMPSRRCPGCGYDLASSNADRCPECGAG